MDYWKNITEIKNTQTEKGIKTYGQRLEDNQDLSVSEIITMAQEEAIDLLMYLEHLKEALNG